MPIAATTSVKTAPRSYVIEMFTVMAIYVALVTSRPYLLGLTDQPLLADLIKVSPALPIWVVLGVAIRFYRRIDEYQQRQLLEAVSLSFGISAALLASYVFLEDVGLPPLHVVWVWPVMGVIWGATTGLMKMFRCAA